MTYTNDDARFAAAQSDPKFVAWLNMMDAVLDIEFLTFNVSGMPDDPYSEEGLRTAEAQALERWASMDEVFTEANQEVGWRYVRYIGETLVRRFEGRWVAVPLADEASEPAVELPFRDVLINPKRLLTAAVARRTGEEWTRVYRYAQQDYDKWKAEGGSDCGQ